MTRFIFALIFSMSLLAQAEEQSCGTEEEQQNLCRAARSGKFDEVKSWLEKFAQTCPHRERFCYGGFIGKRGALPASLTYYSPLDYAIFEGHAEVVGLFLDYGSDLQKTFYQAVKWEEPAVVAETLTRKPDINDEEAEWRLPPLVEAAGNGDLKTVELLLENDANPNISNGRALIEAVGEYTNPQVVQKLIAAGVSVNSTDSSGDSVIVSFFTKNFRGGENAFETFETLMKAEGIDINAAGMSGTPLQLAIDRFRRESKYAERLLAKEAHVDGLNLFGRTPLMELVRGEEGTSHVDDIEDVKPAAEFLLGQGADPNAKDYNGISVLRWAKTNPNLLEEDRQQIVDFLKQNGAKE